MITKEELTTGIEETIDTLFPLIEIAVKSGEEIEPQVLLLFETKSGVIETRPVPGVGIFFRNNEMKEKLPGFIRLVRDKLKSEDISEELRGDELVAVVLISDVFWATEKKEEGEELSRNIEDYIAPSQRPDRKEAIMFSCHMKGYNFMRIYPYRRGEKIVFEEVERMDGDSGVGRFANLFPD